MIRRKTLIQFATIAWKKKIFRKSKWYYKAFIKLNPDIKVYFDVNIKLLNKRIVNEQTYKYEIIIPVFNALESTKECFSSILKVCDIKKIKIIFINDLSDEKTTLWLRNVCQNYENIFLIENFQNLGYTQAVNTGLKVSEAPYVVLLNSDTIVTKGWLEKMLTCMESSEKIGIVGPLSNAAMWQNVPQLKDKNDKFIINDLPEGLSVDDMAALVEDVSFKVYPRVTFVNGFCFMIRREVVDAIGYMDEENFPVGYGEEKDYCIRAQDVGFELAIADDVYVYHSKSKSFGHEKRINLSRQGTQSLKAKHTVEKYFSLAEKMKENRELETVRKSIQDNLNLNKGSK